MVLMLIKDFCRSHSGLLLLLQFLNLIEKDDSDESIGKILDISYSN